MVGTISALLPTSVLSTVHSQCVLHIKCHRVIPFPLLQCYNSILLQMLPMQTRNVLSGRSPFHRLAADCVPFVPDFSKQVVQFLSVIWQHSFFFQGSPSPDRGVVNRLFSTKGLLEILSFATREGHKRNVFRMHKNLQVDSLVG